MNRESWGALAIVILLVGVAGFFTYLNYEQPNYSNKSISGTVLRHHHGATGKTAADPYFIVKLANGQEVKVEDTGVLPVTYRGEVEVIIGKSDTTGLARYAFAASTHNKSLQPMR